MNWEDWKKEFQKLMYEDDLKTEYIEALSNDWWVGYFKGLHEKGLTPKEAYEVYLEEATEEP